MFEMDFLHFTLLAASWTFIMFGLGTTWGQSSAEYEFEKRNKKTD